MPGRSSLTGASSTAAHAYPSVLFTLATLAPQDNGFKACASCSHYRAEAAAAPSGVSAAARCQCVSYLTIFSSLFGVPSLGLEILSAVAPSVSAFATSAGLASWWPLR